MKFLLSLLFVLASVFFTAPTVLAVDASISPYCRGDAAKDHANFCAAVANNKSLGTQSSGADKCNPDSPRYRGPCE